MTGACRPGNPEASGGRSTPYLLKGVSPLLFLQALQKDKMAEAYSEIGMKGEVSAAVP